MMKLPDWAVAGTAAEEAKTARRARRAKLGEFMFMGSTEIRHGVLERVVRRTAS
jgi:hypothetical protein